MFASTQCRLKRNVPEENEFSCINTIACTVPAISLLMNSSDLAGLATGIVAQIKSLRTAVHQSLELMQKIGCRKPASHNIQVTELRLELDCTDGELYCCWTDVHQHNA